MRYLSVEGNIGAGKSSVIEGLAQSLSNKIVTGEPVGSWMGILPRFYEHPAEHALELQMEILRSRLLQIRDLEDDLILRRRYHHRLTGNNDSGDCSQSPPPMLLERCPESSSEVFVPCLVKDGYLTPEEHDTYMGWYDLTKRLSGNRLAGVIYVYATPEKCLERVHKRNREGETGVTLEYLKLLDEGYQKWLDTCRKDDIPVHVIDANNISVEQATRNAISAVIKISDGKSKEKEEDAVNQDQEEEEWIRFATEMRDTDAERCLESVMQMERYLIHKPEPSK